MAAAILMAAFRIAGSTALTMSATMVRMYIGTCEPFRKGSDESTAGPIACVHIKAYDTHAVPHSKKHSAYFHHYTFHTKRQKYKFSSN